MGLEPVSLRKWEDTEAPLKQLFARGGLNISKLAILGNAMRNDTTQDDMILIALGVIMKEEDGLMKEYRITMV